MKVILKLCLFLLNDRDFLKVGLKEQNNMLDGSKKENTPILLRHGKLNEPTDLRHKETNRHIQFK